MLFETGSFNGNGSRGFQRVGFRPKAILWKTDTTQRAGLWMEHMWCDRSNTLGAGSSYISGITVNDDGFYFGSSALVNNLNVTTHWMAIGDDGSGDFEVQSWAGNATAGRSLYLAQQKLSLSALIKRDSPREAAYKVGASPTVFMNGGAASDCIAFTSPGLVTLTAANEVNEWNSAGGLGEGIDGLFFFGGLNSATVTWTGDGVVGRSIPLGISDVVGAIVAHPSVGTSSRLLTNTMGTSSAPVTNVGLVANEGQLVGSNLVIGSSLGLNTNGLIYSATVFSRKVAPKRYAPAIKVKNNQAVFLPANGVGSYINCGTSDATLKFDGSISYEFCGAVYFNPTAASIVDGQIIARGNGPYDNAGGYSFSLLAGGSNDGALGWNNAQIAPQVTDRMGLNGASLDTSNWRTGIIMPWGQIAHYIATFDYLTGQCFLYLNGKLVKQSKRVAGSIAGIAGHPTVIGARSSSGSFVRNTKLLVKDLAVYNRALTADEAYARYARSMLGSTTYTDVTSGLAERWDANNAGIALLPGIVNSANNGTIVLGNIVTL